MSNFEFLKKTDVNLFKIANEAEKLYRDEYFEQCITQTRRFAENICKNMLAPELTIGATFDDMLATLKDKSNGSIREKEFIDDLYFLKREGNASVHSLKIKQDAFTALECLQRAFEAGINYALAKDKTDKKLLKLEFDEELLILGTKKKKSLQEKYLEEKARASRFEKKPGKASAKPLKQKTKPKLKSKEKVVSKRKRTLKKSGLSWFWKLIFVMAVAGVAAGYFLIH